ncbi:phenylacetic acid degradation protein PaaN [Elongatibacter sediminis]|uniref:Phenylacetic acid degradation protein PaaN n=1 Tax=Elongatibacter sediminis TaxID=3119006 RepID=A0AAW9RGC1_9GAMM
MHTLLETHLPTLKQASDACRTRAQWSGFKESPSTRLHGEEAPAAGKRAFESLLGQPFELELPGVTGHLGEEVSPYTREPLGIDYPVADPEISCRAGLEAMRSWRRLDPDQRAALCIEMLRALESVCFESTHATMHTAGQSYMMGFVGSGANALDRGLEAVVYAHRALTDLPGHAVWRKAFGKTDVALEKRYHFVPRGLALVICCASFPTWNAYPSIMANLMTGNAAIVKPHPGGILPMAIAVREMRRVLAANGLDPNMVLLAVDTRDEPVAQRYLERGEVAIVDFTGSQRFGSWLEQNLGNKRIYTETSGVNSIVIESTDNLDGMLDAVAHSLCLFSAQMCTSPQNIHIPAGGVETDQGRIGPADLALALAGRVDARVGNPAQAAGLCGALQAQNTVELLARLADRAADVGELLRAPEPYAHPEYPNARTATPLIIATERPGQDVLKEEHFGPVSFVITHADPDSALASAAATAATRGAIATHVYSVDNDYLDAAEQSFVDAGASLTCNLTGPMPLNFAAAYSDMHVTGLNPAGNACLTDLAFVADRFRIVQCRWPQGTRTTT